MSALNDWPAPSAWLYGFVDTSVPGYRRVSTPGVKQVSSGYYSFPAFVSQLNSQLATGDSATTDSLGRVTLSAVGGITWTDRLGWLIGMDVKPGDSAGSATSRTSDRPPPAGIPLMAASWSRIDRAVETTIAVDRHQRGHGYLFGDNELVRFRLLMHVQSLRSFREGWCLSGQVIVSTKSPSDFSSDAEWSTSNTDGYIQGYVVGVERGKWVDDTQTLWQTELVVART
tara:strand:+ start:4750 stop:5433 length:684 start_codon:yes stop_codon:yes gene_type:complete